ncbi:hypothetical protein RN001_004818 [Aquatica leii]|uniref:CLIP domain-containing serine protease n=1 Tax=Aquatica leii TaxID=1421715 RepID=A0AAN7PBV9_9COLE|nr:hypothetical protein RN001_004818 [Aquatica leii]
MYTRATVFCFIIVLLPSAFGADLKRGARCITPNGEAAHCQGITNCQVILNGVQTNNQSFIKFAQDSQCGYDDEPLVCCGTIGFRSRRGSSCTTPNKELANCVPAASCDVIINELNRSSRDAEVINFAKQSQCGYDIEALLCCGTTARPFKKRILEHPLLPQKDMCGYEKGTDRVHGGEIADKDELPWMALLRYRYNNGSDAGFKCGGTLINNRYVLTAAHCVIVNNYFNFQLDSVRLGEWRISTEMDCDNLANNECTDPVVDLKIERNIPHNQYNGRSGKHDIALIRLERAVRFTDYIKPICIPAADQPDPPLGQKLIIAGWGQTEHGSTSDYKLRAEVPVASRNVCSQKIRNRAPITEDQICAGGDQGKDSCQGDSGGPLMGKFPEIIDGRKQFYQEGVVAFGITECGIKGFPAVYTRVSMHTDWITATIKP